MMDRICIKRNASEVVNVNGIQCLRLMKIIENLSA